MHRRHLLAGIAATSALAACGMPAGDGGRLIVLRHTERTGENLNAEGIARARALPAALSDIRPIDAIFAPDRQRNIDTAAPLARARGQEVEIIPAVNIAATMLRRHPGGTVAWVGNKDNLAALWEEIGAHGEPPIHYGEVFIVAMTGLRAGAIERRRFGT